VGRFAARAAAVQGRRLRRRDSITC
jgi:hypothetical protein